MESDFCQMSESSRVLLVGWDAADWKVIHPLVDQGLMPHTAALVERGVSGSMATLKPAFSPMLWTSIATGKRPYKHGIHGFSEVTPDGKGVRPITNLNRRARAIWNILTLQQKRSMVVGWWPSHPAEPINGVMVSNHYYEIAGPLSQRWDLMKGAVQPLELRQELAELRVHPEDLTPEDLLPFLPTGPEIDQDVDHRVATLSKMLAECSSIQSCATHLMTQEPWDFMAVYFDAIDHFCHAFMKYHPPCLDGVSEEDFRHYHRVVTTAYQYHDLMLGRLLELAGEDVTVLLISDHGFHSDQLRPLAIPAEPAGPASEHRDFGIFVMAGPGVRQDALIHGATLLDVTPTILTAFGLPVGEDMDGRCLKDVWETQPSVSFIESWDDVEGADGSHPPDVDQNLGVSAAAMEQLAALGYVDPLADDMEDNVRKTRQELDYNLAISYMDGGQHGEAAGILARLYGTNPLEFRFGIQLAQCLRALDMLSHLEQLLDHIEKGWEVAAEAARVQLKRIAEHLKIAQAKINASSDEDESNLGPRKLTQKQQHVLRQLRSIARGNPRTLKFQRSMLALARGDAEQATEYLQQASDSSVQMAGFHLQLGSAQLRLRQSEAAIASFQRALEIDADRSFGHLGLCRAFLQQRQISRALEAVKDALALNWQFPVAHFFKARCHFHLRQPEEAIVAAEQALTQNPNFAEACLLLSRIYRRHRLDRETAAEYRSLAQGIRRANRARSLARELPDLPPIVAEDFAIQLPEFPMDDHTRWLPAIEEAPLDSDNVRDESWSDEVITVVSGLPRSGTSMMMQMLVAGGLRPMTDDLRAPDENNPKGYFELEKVKRLQYENSWLPDARGHALKVVAPLLPSLPQSLDYRVIFMERNMDEVMKSQDLMLEQLQLPQQTQQTAENEVRNALIQQARHSVALCGAHHIPVLVVSHRDVISDPLKAAEAVQQFLQAPLDVNEMAAVVDPSLHRQKRQSDHSDHSRG